MATVDPEREHFFELMRRMVRLGALLPFGRDDEIGMELALSDPEKRATVEMIIKEMGKVDAEITAMCAAYRAEREAAG